MCVFVCEVFHSPYHAQLGPSALVFYDAPTPPPGVFDEFLSIPSLVKNVSTTSFPALIKSSMTNSTYGSR